MRGRYSKQWWRGLTKPERRELATIMMAKHCHSLGGGGYLPEDCGECNACGEPMLGTGLCDHCYAIYRRLSDKADAKLKRAQNG